MVGHEASEQHQASLKLETEEQCDVKTAFNRPLDQKEFQAVVCTTKLLHVLMKHNIPHHTVFKDLLEFAVDELKIPGPATSKQRKQCQIQKPPIH